LCEEVGILPLLKVGVLEEIAVTNAVAIFRKQDAIANSKHWQINKTLLLKFEPGLPN
jgi:hypothetical protein